MLLVKLSLFLFLRNSCLSSVLKATVSSPMILVISPLMPNPVLIPYLFVCLVQPLCVGLYPLATLFAVCSAFLASLFFSSNEDSRPISTLT